MDIDIQKMQMGQHPSLDVLPVMKVKKRVTERITTSQGHSRRDSEEVKGNVKAIII